MVDLLFAQLPSLEDDGESVSQTTLTTQQKKPTDKGIFCDE